MFVNICGEVKASGTWKSPCVRNYLLTTQKNGPILADRISRGMLRREREISEISRRIQVAEPAETITAHLAECTCH